MDPLIAIDQPAPDFSLPGLDGKLYRLKDQRGKVVVLDFWSAECPWSERADRVLPGYLTAWGERVVLWAIASNQNETLEQLKQTSSERGLLVVLRDEKNQVADLYGAQSTPHMFVVDGAGILRYQGALDDVTFRRPAPTQYYLREAVEAVLAGHGPEPAQTPGYGCAIVRAYG